MFRNLSPTMGRFNRPDPYDGSYDQSNPQSLNRYSYVLNNPLGYLDPLGLQVCYNVVSRTTIISGDYGQTDFYYSVVCYGGGGGGRVGVGGGGEEAEV
jgi:hypothetical protein